MAALMILQPRSTILQPIARDTIKPNQAAVLLSKRLGERKITCVPPPKQQNLAQKLASQTAYIKPTTHYCTLKNLNRIKSGRFATVVSATNLQVPMRIGQVLDRACSTYAFRSL